MKSFKLKLYEKKLTGHQQEIVAFNTPQGPEGGILISISKDSLLRVWDLFEESSKIKNYLSKFTNEEGEGIETMDLSQEEREELEETIERDRKENPLTCAIFNQKTVFCGYKDGSIYAWNFVVIFI